MRTRLRFFAALLALLALTTSVVEQARAAACVEMEGPAATAAAPAAGHPHAGHAAGAHDAPAPDEHRGTAPSERAPCPMTAASGMVCGVAALPVPASPGPLGPESRMAVPPAADEAPGSLALSSLFRPPRR